MIDHPNVVRMRDYERPKMKSHVVRKRTDAANRAFYFGPPDDLSMGQADPEIIEADRGDCA